LNQLAPLRPNDPVVHTNLGVALYRTGDIRAAESAFKKALDLDRTQGEAWAGLAVAALDAGGVNEAVATARQGVASAPRSTAVRVALVEALRRSGDGAAAVTAAQEALAQDAFALPLHNAMGLAYLDRGEPELARFVFEKALGSVPGADKNAEIRCNLGRVYLAVGDRILARVAFAEALQLDDRNLPAQVQLGRMYVQDHAYLQALPLLERAAAQDPDNVGLLVDLGIALRGVSRYEDAEAAYRKAIALNPTDPTPLLNLAILLGDYKKDFAGGQSAANDYVKRGGTDTVRAKELADDLKREARDADRRRKAAEDAQKQQRRGESQPPPDAPPVEPPPAETPPAGAEAAEPPPPPESGGAP
jgi:Flp pilus assembly protein TadD